MKSLDHVSVVEIAGEDAHSFLQRQITVDMDEVTPDRSRLAAYLNPKGRVIANFIIIVRQQGYCLVVSNELADTLCERLRKYVFREKIDILKRSDLFFFGVRDICGVRDSELPQNPYENISINGMTVVRIPGSPARFGALAEESALDRSAAKASTISTDLWTLQDIEAGIPWIARATGEQFVAQAINLDLVGSLSWTKGCYPGQEIVARMHYRGGISRRMMQATCLADSNPYPGALISCPELAGNQTGTVVNCNSDDNSNQASLLISIPLRFAERDSLLLSESFPVKLRAGGLPYKIPQLA